MTHVDLSVGAMAARPSSPLTALAVPGIWRGLYAAGALMLGFYGTYAFVGAHVDVALGRGTDGAGVVTLCYGLGFGLATFIDRYTDPMDPRYVGGLAFAGLTLIYLIMSWGGSGFYLLMGIALFWGVVQHVGLNFVVSRLAGLDPSQRGAILGLNSAVTYLAVTGGALMFRPLFEIGGLALCNVASAVIVAGAVGESRRARIRTSPSDG
jgi:predicted MFS family arabinose efflux permease